MPSQQQRVTFTGSQGDELAATLRLPAGPTRAYALFAHCFTCGKDGLAAARIASALTDRGIAVLRFDFTGLGGSDGDFANTNFTSNVEDLLAAAAWLTQEHAAPSLLIGHSLGGTAALMAASRIDGCKAVATIGAPSAPDHVIAQFDDRLEAIQRDGVAEVTLGGRSFSIKAQFIDDARAQDLDTRLRQLRRALLVLHAPLDDVVRIDEATRIFTTALHPKSFVSLDSADHLLTEAADARYAAEVIASWASRYIGAPADAAAPPASADDAAARPKVAPGEVLLQELDHAFARSVLTDDHTLLADEPTASGGSNRGPDPYELLLAALGACTSMTVRMYANHKQWPLDDVTVTLSHQREHASDCEGCDESGQRLEVLQRKVQLQGDLSAEQRTRLLQIADRCPVHRTLTGTLKVRTTAA